MELLPKAKLAGIEIKLYENLTYNLYAACGYCIKLQHQEYTERHTTDNIYIYIYEKSQLNTLVWGLLTLTPITSKTKLRIPLYHRVQDELMVLVIEVPAYLFPPSYLRSAVLLSLSCFTGLNRRKRGKAQREEKSSLCTISRMYLRLENFSERS